MILVIATLFPVIFLRGLRIIAVYISCYSRISISDCLLGVGLNTAMEIKIFVADSMLISHAAMSNARHSRNMNNGIPGLHIPFQQWKYFCHFI